MIRFTRAFLLALLLSLLPSAAMAADITGILKDKTTGEPLIDAAVRLLAAKDSAFVKGVTANAQGIFKLSDVKPGSYIVQCTYIGYNNANQNVKVANANIRLGEIKMGESTEMLREVSVIGIKTPIKVMEDTVEYNADSYKTQPNAVVEDLLKRLPGVEVDSDGKITANGKSVTKILVDGKEFFSDDPKVASKNLPAEMIDKLQVVDRKSDTARLTGVDDGDDETVINLTFKKGMNQGWFGTATGGFGTSSHYLGNFNANHFWNGNQITFLGNFNDINQMGFTDSNGARFQRYGGGNGLTTSRSLGVNFNIGNKEIFRVGGDVMWSNTDTRTESRRDRQNILPDSTTYSKIDKTSRDRGNNFRGDFRMLWKPDSFNVFELRPNFSANFNRSNDYGNTAYLNSYMFKESDNTSKSFSKGASYEFGGRFIYSHNFKAHRGRSFSISGNYDYSNVVEHSVSYNDYIKYILSEDKDNTKEGSELLRQYTENLRWTDRIGARFTWTEPLGNVAKGHYLTFSYRANYRWNKADKQVYNVDEALLDDLQQNFPSLSDLGLSPDSLYAKGTNIYDNYSSTNEFRLGYKKQTKTMSFEGGLSTTRQGTKSVYTSNPNKNQERTVWNWAPFLRYRYKFSKNSSLQANYRGQSNQPSMSQLQPVVNESNPTNIIQGNPNLLPSFDHNMELRFQDFNMDQQRSMMFMGNFSFTQNSIATNTKIYDKGKRYTTYENVNGVWGGRFMNMFSMPFSNKKWSFSNHLFFNANHNVGFNNGQKNYSLSLGVGENPGINFRPDHFDIEIRPNYWLQATRNSLQTTNYLLVHRYGARGNLMYYTDWGLTVQTDVMYSQTSGYANGYDTKIWRWNASISQQLLRSRALTVSVRAYDILNQNQNISRNVTANYIDDTWNNSLTRYVMFTVAYKFNTFGKGNQPQTNNLMADPRGGHGPGGHGPGGGRPGRGF